MSKQVIETGKLMKPIAHFSHAVRIGNLLHIGATAGTDAAVRLAGSSPGLADMQAQTAQMFANIGTVLELCGATIDDVVRIKTYLTDLRDLDKYRTAFTNWSGGRELSHTVVGSAGFPLPQALVEADLVVIAGGGARKRPASGSAQPQSGVRVDERHYFSVCANSGRGAHADAMAHMETAFDALASGLAAAGLRIEDVVNLHATIVDVRDMGAFESAFRKVFSTCRPSGSIVIAPLFDPLASLQLESVAVAGGGSSIGNSDSFSGHSLFSPAMLAGEELYVSGQMGAGEQQPVKESLEAQTRHAWQNVTSLLAGCGMSREHILRTNNILTDWRFYGGFNAGYGANVTKPYPPRATVLGGLSNAAARVQVEGIAHRQGDSATVLTVPGMN